MGLGIPCGEDPAQQVLLTGLTSLRQKSRNRENRVGEALPRMATQICLSLSPSMVGLEASLSLKVSDTFIPHNTPLMPASLPFSWFHSRPRGHGAFHTLRPATQLLSVTHESHSVRAASRRNRATGSPPWDTRGPGQETKWPQSPEDPP